jgi:hypothetical protein
MKKAEAPLILVAVLVCAVLFVLCSSAQAQQKILHRVGVLVLFNPDIPELKGLRDGLRGILLRLNPTRRDCCVVQFNLRGLGENRANQPISYEILLGKLSRSKLPSFGTRERFLYASISFWAAVSRSKLFRASAILISSSSFRLFSLAALLSFKSRASCSESEILDIRSPISNVQTHVLHDLVA